MGKDIYISILELGKDKGLSGVTGKDIYEYLKRKKHITCNELRLFITPESTDEGKEAAKKQRKISRILEDVFRPHSGIEATDVEERVMTMDSYFKLLEHQELVEARENARDARKEAAKASKLSLIVIILAIVAIVVSAGFTCWQIFQPITINSEQLNQLTTPSFKEANIVTNINAVSNKQKNLTIC